MVYSRYFHSLRLPHLTLPDQPRVQPRHIIIPLLLLIAMSSSSSSSFSSSSSTRNALRHPIRTLILAFAAWKFFLLLIALASPGRGYDTSTSLVLHAPPQHLQHLQPPNHEIDRTTESGAGPLPAALHYLVTKLTRWDAIYFTQAAARGYRFEQEWAFGWGLTKLIALVTAGKSWGVSN